MTTAVNSNRLQLRRSKPKRSTRQHHGHPPRTNHFNYSKQSAKAPSCVDTSISAYCAGADFYVESDDEFEPPKPFHLRKEYNSFHVSNDVWIDQLDRANREKQRAIRRARKSRYNLVVHDEFEDAVYTVPNAKGTIVYRNRTMRANFRLSTMLVCIRLELRDAFRAYNDLYRHRNALTALEIKALIHYVIWLKSLKRRLEYESNKNPPALSVNLRKEIKRGTIILHVSREAFLRLCVYYYIRFRCATQLVPANQYVYRLIRYDGVIFIRRTEQFKMKDLESCLLNSVVAVESAYEIWVAVQFRMMLLSQWSFVRPPDVATRCHIRVMFHQNWLVMIFQALTIYKSE